MKASYFVSDMIAKVGKPHTIGELLLKPAMVICAKEVLGETEAKMLENIPLSNNPIQRRQEEG